MGTAGLYIGVLGNIWQAPPSTRQRLRGATQGDEVMDVVRVIGCESHADVWCTSVHKGPAQPRLTPALPRVTVLSVKQVSGNTVKRRVRDSSPVAWDCAAASPSAPQTQQPLPCTLCCLAAVARKALNSSLAALPARDGVGATAKW